MSLKSLVVPPAERDNLTLREAAAQLAISPNHLDVSRCPHAWRTAHRGEHRIPWCCVRAYGQQDPAHEREVLVLKGIPSAA